MNNKMRNRIQEILIYEKTNQKTPRDVPNDSNTNNNENDPSSTTTTTDVDYTYNVNDFVNSSIQNSINDSKVQNQNTNLLGIPHQFLPTADYRMPGNELFGYCFLKDIYSERPIVTIMPGTANYLPDYNKADKNAFSSLMTDSSEAGQQALNDLIGEHAESRYYEFKADYSSYIQYVNLLCRVAAVYLGIAGELGPDGKTTYKYYDWGNYQAFNNYSTDSMSNNSIFDDSGINDAYSKLENLNASQLAGYKQYVSFYIDPSSTVSETASNMTQKSQLEGAFDTVEGIVKEATMLISSANDYQNTISSFVDTATSAVAGLANTVTLGAFKNLLGLAEKEVLHGANLIYPEIWMDSDFSKTYSIVLNLSSPYGDREAVYLNVIVPILHALCLALPRQTTANTFTTPFLVRAFTNGWFSCDMGIVESITIDKGPEQSWTPEGLPMRAKVTLNIKDLYSQLMISEPKASLFFTNQGMIDYLAALCGVDLTKPNIVLKMQTFQALMGGNIGDFGTNIYRDLIDGIYNLTEAFRL